MIAHRGASSERAEHTLAAYQRAIEQGADALECDVRLTADGHVVCVHDRRIDRTSDGKGIVSAKTLDQLQRHDFGSWWTGSEDEPDYDEERQTVLTLERLLDLATSYDRPVRLAIETKHPNRYGGYLEDRVVETLEQFGLAHPPRDGSSPVVMMSFSEIAMRRVRLRAPSMPTVFLMERVPLRFRMGALPYRAAVGGPGLEIIRKHPDYVERLHAAGRRVFVWTVDDAADVDFCRDLGVDAVISNRPQHVLRHLTSG